MAKKDLYDEIVRVYEELLADAENNPHTGEEVVCIIAASCKCDIRLVEAVLDYHLSDDEPGEPVLQMYRADNAYMLSISPDIVENVDMSKQALEHISEKDLTAFCGITALSSGIAGISAGLLASGYAIEDICNAIQGELENHLIAAGVPSSVSLVPRSQNSTGAKGKLLHFPS